MTGEEKDKLAEILPQLNINQLRYLSIRQECASDQDAADQLGVKVSTIYGWPPVVKEALTLMLCDGVMVASEILRRNTPKAAAIKAEGLDSADERIRQDSAQEILDRMLGKPTQRQEHSGPGGGAITINWSMIEGGDDADA